MIAIPECETCGKSSELFRARIEDTFLNVCKTCSKLGQVLQETKAVQITKAEPRIENIRIIEIAPDFPQRIRSAREEKKLTRKDLAERLKEKETVIARIENGMRPTRRLAEKLEKVLSVSLFYEEREQKLPAIKTEELTIGDIVEIRMRKKA